MAGILGIDFECETPVGVQTRFLLHVAHHNGIYRFRYYILNRNSSRISFNFIMRMQKCITRLYDTRGEKIANQENVINVTKWE